VKHCWETQRPLFDGDKTVRIQVATRWHFDDVNQHIIRVMAPQFLEMQRKGLHAHLPDQRTDQYPDDKCKVFLLGTFDDDGGVIWPEKYSPEEIEQIRSEMTEYFFSCQYLNNPVPEEARDFKNTWFRYYTVRTGYTTGGVLRTVYNAGGRDIPADELSFKITVDPAFEVKPKNDHTAIVVCGHWLEPVTGQRWLFVVEYIRDKLRPDVAIKKIDGLARKWNVREVGVESHAAQVLYTEMVRQTAQWIGEQDVEVIPIKRGGESHVGKARVRRLVPYYRDGRIYHAQHMAAGVLETELLAFTGGQSRGESDDLSDALSDQVDFGRPAGAANYDPFREAVRDEWGHPPEFEDWTNDWKTR